MHHPFRQIIATNPPRGVFSEILPKMPGSSGVSGIMPPLKTNISPETGLEGEISSPFEMVSFQGLHSYPFRPWLNV